jgi:hypothetical protein
MAVTSGLSNSQSMTNAARRIPETLKVGKVKAKSDLLLTAKQIAQQKKNKAKKTLKVDSAAKMIQSSKPDPETSIEGYLRIGKRQYT